MTRTQAIQDLWLQFNVVSFDHKGRRNEPDPTTPRIALRALGVTDAEIDEALSGIVVT
ncbi:hypothetical protein [Rhodococcoides fascians]|uniref:hypothetical protein n=1 Tax=Rhodococcoides fascians TaxID=1828 RepID=UPI000A4BDC19|nr:hypothetical protein [Rhodococcus fascians]